MPHPVKCMFYVQKLSGAKAISINIFTCWIKLIVDCLFLNSNWQSRTSISGSIRFNGRFSNSFAIVGNSVIDVYDVTCSVCLSNFFIKIIGAVLKHIRTYCSRKQAINKSVSRLTRRFLEKSKRQFINVKYCIGFLSLPVTWDTPVSNWFNYLDYLIVRSWINVARFCANIWNILPVHLGKSKRETFSKQLRMLPLLTICRHNLPLRIQSMTHRLHELFS